VATELRFLCPLRDYIYIYGLFVVWVLPLRLLAVLRYTGLIEAHLFRIVAPLPSCDFDLGKRDCWGGVVAECVDCFGSDVALCELCRRLK